VIGYSNWLLGYCHWLLGTGLGTSEPLRSATCPLPAAGFSALPSALTRPLYREDRDSSLRSE